MANKRMFSLAVIDTDAFLEMPLSTQALYFHLCMRADDDGFIGNPKKIARMIGANEDDLRMLVAKRFVLSFDTGVIVIKHWRMHNTLSKDRYKETNFIENKEFLRIKPNNAYTFSESEGIPLNDAKLIEKSGRQTVDAQKTNRRRTEDEQKTTERRTEDEQKTNADKNSIDKIRENKNKEDKIIQEELDRFAWSEVDIERLLEAFIDYKNERRARKNTMTERSIKQQIKNLHSYSNGDIDTAVKIIEQSIANGWTGLFELRNTGKESKTDKLHKFYEDVDKWAEGED